MHASRPGDKAVSVKPYWLLGTSSPVCRKFANPASQRASGSNLLVETRHGRAEVVRSRWPQSLLPCFGAAAAAKFHREGPSE